MPHMEFAQFGTLYSETHIQRRNKVEYYFITGTSKGIGKALAERILERNDVSVTGIARTNSLSATNFRFVPMDLSDVKAAVDFEFPACSDATKIVLVNNAGALGKVKRVGELNSNDIISVLNLNLSSVTALINKFLATFSKKNVPLVILNISSGAGKNAIDGWAAYCASKAGLDMFSKVVAEELAISGKKHIRIFSVAPGVVDTAMQDQIRTSSEADFSRIQQFIEYKSTGQLADPRLIAEKLLSILDRPEKNAETIFSAKDIAT